MNVRCVCALGGGGGGGGGWNVFFCCGRVLKMLRIGPAPNIFFFFFFLGRGGGGIPASCWGVAELVAVGGGGGGGCGFDGGWACLGEAKGGVAQGLGVDAASLM